MRRAVELADDWQLTRWDNVIRPKGLFAIGIERQVVKDALAAQLVRQVDNQIGSWVEISPTQTKVYGDHGDHKLDGPDRTMNTLKAIIDSGVLDE